MIGDLAERFARVVGFSPGGDLLDVVEKKLGGKLRYAEANEWLDTASGSIEVLGPNRFTITLANFTGPNRNRFTIAHELGHYVLHSQLGNQPLKAPRKGNSPAEREADWFAAAFLMPREPFKKALLDAGDPPNLYLLVGRFQVSIPAVEYRIEGLKIDDLTAQ
ncbi:MAG: ImmA/IrrE family metallo-endopeptidase [Magnetococcales bacterium]|nr:ImmA/IrrE family metallo-endopeptidase [Magnetococcales bacterium]